MYGPFLHMYAQRHRNARDEFIAFMCNEYVADLKIMFIISIAKEFRKVQSFVCKHAHLCAPFPCLIPLSDQLFIVPPAFKIISAPICKLVKRNARAHILDRNETLMSA